MRRAGAQMKRSDLIIGGKGGSKGLSSYVSKRDLRRRSERLKAKGGDWKMQQFITNKEESIIFNQNLLAFVFYFNDSHIYLIKDKEMRHSLLNSHDKSDIISLISKEAENNKSEREIKVDIPF